MGEKQRPSHWGRAEPATIKGEVFLSTCQLLRGRPERGTCNTHVSPPRFILVSAIRSPSARQTGTSTVAAGKGSRAGSYRGALPVPPTDTSLTPKVQNSPFAAGSSNFKIQRYKQLPGAANRSCSGATSRRGHGTARLFLAPLRCTGGTELMLWQHKMEEEFIQLLLVSPS